MGGKGNNRKRGEGKLNQSANDSKSSDSSSGNDLERSHNNSEFQTTEDNSFKLATDISSLSTSGGSISTSTPIYDRNDSRGAIKKRGGTVIQTPNRQTPNRSPLKKSESKTYPNDSNLGGYFKRIFLVVCCLVGIYLCFSFMGRTCDSDKVTKLISMDELKLNLEKSFDKLKLKFTLKDEYIWDDLMSGILDVIDLNRQAIFLLIYSDNGNTVRKLSEAVAKIAAETIKSDKNIEAIVMNSQHLNIEPYRTDHGKLITKYRDELEEHGVLIVHDLHLVEANVARAFHTICDSYNPIVEQSVIIFTMQVDSLTNGKATEIGEKRLTQVWSKELDIDVLQALVTRLTVNVLKIQ
ncbi:uncharacterized protein LOC123290499 isoform X2 [Chrysoperla carnea]|nr:uncharacterized protein LOC123290499 isoform X2 [Chrysoperla carnea]